MLDITELRHAKPMRFTALVDQRLKNQFTAYESLFDAVYYFEVQYTCHFFIESFSLLAENIVEHELGFCRQLQLLNFGEGDLEATAKLRDKFHLSGLSFIQAQKFRNKILMKETVENNGMLVPKGMYIDWNLSCETLFQQCATKLNTPFVIKPVNLSGSLGVTFIHSYEQFEAYYQNHITTDYMAEEAIQGDLLHLDLVVSDGTVKWFGCSRYNLPLIAFLQKHPIGSMPLREESDLYQRLRTYALNVVHSFQIEDSILHIEVFYKNDMLYFLEVAARAGGGLVPLVYKKMFGFNLIQAYICYQLGITYGSEITDGLSYFWLCLHNEDDVQDKLRRLDIHSLFFPKAEGIQIPGSIIGQFNRILGFHNDYEYLQKAFMSFF